MRRRSRTDSRRTLRLKGLNRKAVAFMVTAGVAGGLMATPAFGAADYNQDARNCHGVVLSDNASHSNPPGQIQKEQDIPVKFIQQVLVEGLC